MFNALIIGCGAIAGGYDRDKADSPDVMTHAKAYNLHPRFRPLACVEPDPAKRQAFQQRWDIPHGFATLAEVDVPFDVASVCVPTQAHADVLEALIERKPLLVFAEKPITDHLSSAQELVKAYERAGIALCVNHLRRWAPGIFALKKEIAAGTWGQLQGGTCHYTKGLLNNGSHMFDLLAYLLGPLHPVARLRDIDDGRDLDPTSDVIVAAPHDVHVHVQGSDGRNFTVFDVDLLFTGGRVSLTESSFTVTRRPVEASAQFPGYHTLAAGEPQDTGMGQAMMKALDNIYYFLSSDHDLASTGATALAAHRLCAVLDAMPAMYPRRH